MNYQAKTRKNEQSQWRLHPEVTVMKLQRVIPNILICGHLLTWCRISYIGILVVYFIFCISLVMLVEHHHCWKCANFPMFRAFTYNDMYSMQIINVKKKKPTKVCAILRIFGVLPKRLFVLSPGSPSLSILHVYILCALPNSTESC